MNTGVYMFLTMEEKGIAFGIYPEMAIALKEKEEEEKEIYGAINTGGSSFANVELQEKLSTALK